MIKLQEAKKSTIEHDIYEARIEEALAKWETEIPSEKETDNINPPKKKRDNNEEK